MDDRMPNVDSASRNSTKMRWYGRRMAGAMRVYRTDAFCMKRWSAFMDRVSRQRVDT
jgi:hypothetical protein